MEETQTKTKRKFRGIKVRARLILWYVGPVSGARASIFRGANLHGAPSARYGFPCGYCRWRATSRTSFCTADQLPRAEYAASGVGRAQRAARVSSSWHASSAFALCPCCKWWVQ